MTIDQVEQNDRRERMRSECNDWAMFLEERQAACRAHGIPEATVQLMLRDLNYIAGSKGFYPEYPPPPCVFMGGRPE